MRKRQRRPSAALEHDAVKHAYKHFTDSAHVTLSRHNSSWPLCLMQELPHWVWELLCLMHDLLCFRTAKGRTRAAAEAVSFEMTSRCQAHLQILHRQGARDAIEAGILVRQRRLHIQVSNLIEVKLWILGELFPIHSRRVDPPPGPAGIRQRNDSPKNSSLSCQQAPMVVYFILIEIESEDLSCRTSKPPPGPASIRPRNESSENSSLSSYPYPGPAGIRQENERSSGFPSANLRFPRKYAHLEVERAKMNVRSFRR